MKKLLVVIIVGLAIALSGGQAFAANASAPIDVVAQITGDCTISATGLNFGQSIGQGDIPGSGSIDVTCTQGLDYAIAMNSGTHYSSGERRMLNTQIPGSFIPYRICKDDVCSILWGPSQGHPLGDHYSGQGSGQNLSLPFYGLIPAGHNQPAGDYNDTVTVTVSW